MSKDNIIRAWKDPEYRSTLNEQESVLLPANPAGAIDEGKLAEVAGGALPLVSQFIPCSVWCSVICPSRFICPA